MKKKHPVGLHEYVSTTHPFALQVTEVEPDIFPCIQVGGDCGAGSCDAAADT